MFQTELPRSACHLSPQRDERGPKLLQYVRVRRKLIEFLTGLLPWKILRVVWKELPLCILQPI